MELHGLLYFFILFYFFEGDEVYMGQDRSVSKVYITGYSVC